MMIPPRSSVVSTSTTGSSTSPAAFVPSIVFDDTPLDQSEMFWSIADATEIESFIDCDAHDHQSDQKEQAYELILPSEATKEREVNFAGHGRPWESFDPIPIKDQNSLGFPFDVPNAMVFTSQLQAQNHSTQQQRPSSTLYATEWSSYSSSWIDQPPATVMSSPQQSKQLHSLSVVLSSPESIPAAGQATTDDSDDTERKGCGVVDVSQAENDSTTANNKSFPSERANLDLSQYSSSTADASRVLLFLGSTLRSKADKFIDASKIVDPRESSRRAQGKELFFPDRLYQLLELSEENGWTDIVSFQPHGRSFRVHDKAAFVARLLPICLQGQGSWSSFLRQLRLYGFTRCESGPDYGAYYHELFLRGRPSLTRYMRRVGVSHGGLDRRTFRLQKGDDPDFYSGYAPMPSLNVHACDDK